MSLLHRVSDSQAPGSMSSSEAPISTRSDSAWLSAPWGRALDESAGILIASTLSAFCILAADRIWRPDWDFSWTDHWRGAPLLYLAAAALMGLAWVNLRLAGQGVSQRFTDSPRSRDWIRASFVGLLAGLCVAPLALKTFSGAQVRETWLAQWGPATLILLACASGLFGTIFMWRLQRRVARRRIRAALVTAAALFFAGGAALWIDMSLYVGLYSHLHEFLEFAAFCLFLSTFQLLGFIIVRRWPAALVLSRIAGGLVVGILIAFATIRPLRTWTDARLSHAWVDEFYVGRALRRVQQLDLQLTSGDSLQMARVSQLLQRFEIEERSLSSKWTERVEPGRSFPGVRNVVFFYVDTLRADVARDLQLMPNLAEFRRGSLDFTRAYATGSDTLRSLPTITAGNYSLDRGHPGDLLSLAKSGGHRSVLVVAQSASEFLQKLLPRFRFDELRAVKDYEEGEQVWGYGAHQATAEGVGRESLAFLKSAAAEDPFFLWMFHFDVHAWRELEPAYIARTRARFGIARDGEWKLRYRVVTRAVDEEFGRLLRVLEETGRDKDTAVVFLSDHGEGLGQGGFWVHSIFLWGSLVHVPLVLRIPGVSPQQVDVPVSLVDIAPTIAPILGGGAASYHGQNLTEGHHALSNRRLPILMRGGRITGLDRVGMVDGDSHRKLVVRLEAAFPELHAYEVDPKERVNLARNESGVVRQLLKELVRSPVFPREDTDFELSADP